MAFLRMSQVTQTPPKHSLSSGAFEWSPASWDKRPNPYNITYGDQSSANEVLQRLKTLPALVPESEVLHLKRALRRVARGEAFLWQGGDCAELFEYDNEVKTTARIALLRTMGDVFTRETGTESIIVGRIAGQYGKPRNTLTELVDGKEIPKFYGDNINGVTPDQREPDPLRLLAAYFHSSSTINRIRSTFQIDSSRIARTARGQVVSSRDIETLVTPIHIRPPPTIFTSHEGLYLHHEQALTKTWKGATSGTDGWYNGSAHFLWIGDKTRQPDGAHVEYFRGLRNPIGVKLGPSAKPQEAIRLLDILDPDKEIGRVSFITRLGSHNAKKNLKDLITAVQKSGHQVVWQCDPMHGNTRLSADGIRTRDMPQILSEIRQSFQMHKECGSWLGGIHLEMTPDAVVECTGGSEGWADSDLGTAYETKCDPRLNGVQALDIVNAVVDHFNLSKESKASFLKSKI